MSCAIEKQPGYLRGELIYPLEDRPTPECHASTIAETREGTLVAAWFGGEREGSPDVGIWLSRNENGKSFDVLNDPEALDGWSRPVQVADGECAPSPEHVEGPGRRFPCWNPVLFQPGNGPLILFFKVGPNPREWWGEMMVSDDGGRSWEDRRALSFDVVNDPEALDGPKGGHAVGQRLEGLTLRGIGPAKNKPVELDDGTIICPSSGEHGSWRVHFELTRDLGRTWEVICPFHDDTIFPSIQPSILTHPGGRLQILCRTRGKGVISESWSSDGGRTWSEMTATSLPNPNSGIDATTLTDGRHLVVYNPITKGRNRLSVALSRDGKDWREVLKLEDEDEGEYSYPAVIQSSDGEVHVTYTFRRASIKHVTLDPEALS